MAAVSVSAASQRTSRRRAYWLDRRNMQSFLRDIGHVPPGSSRGEIQLRDPSATHAIALTGYHLYVNATSKLQVLRIANVPDWYFERVVFPGQQLFIEARPEAVLEVYTGNLATAILEAKIACESLEIVWL